MSNNGAKRDDKSMDKSSHREENKDSCDLEMLYCTKSHLNSEVESSENELYGISPTEDVLFSSVKQKKQYKTAELGNSGCIQWSNAEDQMIIDFYLQRGSNWKLLSEIMNDRPSHLIKTRFYSTLRRKVPDNLIRFLTKKQCAKTELILQDQLKFYKSNQKKYSIQSERCHTEEEKRRKVLELHGIMQALQASISRTQDQIEMLANEFSHNN